MLKFVPRVNSQTSSNIAFCPQRPYRLLGRGSPGRPPQLSHSSWVPKLTCNVLMARQQSPHGPSGFPWVSVCHVDLYLRHPEQWSSLKKRKRKKKELITDYFTSLWCIMQHSARRSQRRGLIWYTWLATIRQSKAWDGLQQCSASIPMLYSSSWCRLIATYWRGLPEASQQAHTS